MRVYTYIAICLLLLVVGCQDIEAVRAPESLLSQDQFEEILYESTLLSAARGYNTGMLSQTGIKPETYILNKFKIDSTTLAQNMAYYAADVEQFKEINSNVLKKLSALYSIKDSLQTIAREKEDSLRKVNIKRNRGPNQDTVNSTQRRFGNLQRVKEALVIPDKLNPVLSDSL